MRFNLFIFSIVIINLISCNNKPRIVNIEIDNYSSLDSVFTAHHTSDSSTVHPVFVNNISPSIKGLSVEERKDVFVKSMLANILLNNHDIILLRDSIIDISKKIDNNKLVSEAETKWLNNIYKTYRCKMYDVDALLKKVYIIPPSMIIAQTIVESGWGTSRFAIEGNSLFGEHFSNGASGEFISANESDTKLKSFTTIYQAVKSYSKNINRHRAYSEFRDIRLEMISNNLELNSLVLVETLGRYSELGDEYINYLKNIIVKNSLQKYDSIKLNDVDTRYFVNIKN